MVQVNVAQIARFHPRTTRMRKRFERAAPAVRPSKAAEMAYRGELLQVVEHLIRAGAAIAHELRPTWTVGDSAPWGGVTDAKLATKPHGFDGAFQRAAAKFGRIGETANRLAGLAARRSLGEVDKRLSRSMLKSVGVDISRLLYQDPKIQHAMALAAKANVELITSIPAQYLDEVRGVVEKSFADGARWETMVGEIARIGDVTKSRAELIAVDQTSKMNAAFNEVRQTSIGIKKYTWSGVLDARERKSHLRMEGKVCRWDSPPMVDGENVHPGMAVRCRCVARALLDLDALESEAA